MRSLKRIESKKQNVFPRVVLIITTQKKNFTQDFLLAITKKVCAAICANRKNYCNNETLSILSIG